MKRHTVTVISRRQLCPSTVEVRFSRPDGFSFVPGQKISFFHLALRRDYTLLGPVPDAGLAVCVRHIPHGRFSPRLARAKPGDCFEISQPFGFFTFKPSQRPAVFVATGTGIAPFVAYVRAGIRGFKLFHGVRSTDELYYHQEIKAAADRLIPCLSGPDAEAMDTAFSGRVGDALAVHLAPTAHDFYLCGNMAMIRDVTRLVDEHYPGSRVYNEAFY